MSSYLNIFTSIYHTAVEVWPKRRITLSFLGDFLADLKRFGRVSIGDIVIVFCLAIGLTFLRSALGTFLLKPFAVNMKFTSKNIIKFSESFWKFSYYLLMYIYTCYLLFGTSYTYFKSPRTCWTDWSVGMHIPTDIYILYVIQASFYVHSLYATFYMDPWRRDSVAMVIHHFLTLFLIGFSFAVRYYKAGVVVLFLHDICDVVLECTKMFMCWKIRDNKQYHWPERFINIGFLAFAISWFYCRLYLYPYKIMYPCGHLAVHMHPHAPFYYFFNGMLFLLFALNVWWFHFIVQLIWRVLTGQTKEIEDTRELGMEEDISSKDKKSSGTQDINIHSTEHRMMDDKNHVATNGNYCGGTESILAQKNNGVVLNHVENHNIRQHDKTE